MSAGATMGRNVNQGRGEIHFMVKGEEPELLQRACLGDPEARLQLVKAYLNLVVEIAAVYETETGQPFAQMVKVGATAISKAVKDFYYSQQTEFDEYVKVHIIKAIEENSYTEPKLQACIL